MPWLTLGACLVLVFGYLWQGWKLQHGGEYGAGELAWLGANVPPLSLGSEPWRLALSVVMHNSVQHLLTNLFTLALIGTLLEGAAARWKWLSVFVGGGVFAAFGSAALNYDLTLDLPFSGVTQQIFVSTGASGAIMSLAGALAVAGFKRQLQTPVEGMHPLLRAGLVFGGLNVFLGLMHSGVDNSAHVMGLLFGALAGFGLFMAAGDHSLKGRLGAVIAALAVVALIGAGLWTALPAAAKREQLVRMARELVIDARQEADGARHP